MKQDLAEGQAETARRLKVCIVAHNAYGAMKDGKSGHIGGIEWQTSLTAKWFAARGHKVSILTWSEGSSTDEIIDGVRVIKICGQKDGLPGLRFFHPKWTALNKALARADADVYYQNGAECVTGQVALWCKRNGRKFVFSVACDLDCDPALPLLPSAREKWLYRYGIRHAQGLVVQNIDQKDRYQRDFGLGSMRIPMPCPGPTDGEFQARRAPPSARVAWIGRLSPEKRPDRLLAIARACPELQFDVVGKPVDAPLVKGFLEAAKTVPNLTVHSPVPRTEMPEVYKRSFCLCSTSDYEGFPNTFLEAWSYGVPVVSFFDPDRLIREKNLGSVVKGEEAMAEALRGLHGNERGYGEVSSNCRAYYRENHRLESAMPQFERLFAEAVAK